MRETINGCRISVGKPEGMRLVGKSKVQWEDTIQMDIQEIGCGLDSSGSV
jgi:hypothetical protein